MKTILALLHSEIVSVYAGVNSILASLVVLNVIKWTPDQIAAAVVIANVVLGPIVRGLVTPTAVRKVAAVAAVAPIITYSSTSGTTATTGNWSVMPTTVTNVSTSTLDTTPPDQPPPDVPPEEPPVAP